ncbi:hypothetical protein BDF19DRAFT_189142 [Syncephalis fuscata]|nr:hypothetical protein BDF19DRAFT_189142 [Syncephalis fuscata]
MLVDVNNSRHVTETLKLLVTIIAYDPTLRIAEHFTKLFRLLLPNCTANDVLSSSIDALSPVMRDFAKHSKYLDSKTANNNSNFGSNSNNNNNNNNNIETKSIISHITTEDTEKRTKNDHIIIRQEYIRLLCVYIEHTGQLTWRQAKCACLVIRSTLKDLVAAKIAHPTEWVGRFLDGLAQIPDRSLITRIIEFFLRQLAPIFNKLFVSADYTGLVDGLARLLGEHNYGNIPSIHELVLDRFIQPMLVGIDRHLAMRDLVGMTGRLLASLLLHRDTDVAALLDTASPQLQCQLLPRICTALAQLTLATTETTTATATATTTTTAAATATMTATMSTTTPIPLSMASTATTTIAMDESKSKPVFQRNLSNSRTNPVKATSLVWRYPLQLIEAGYTAVLTIQSSKTTIGINHSLGPGARRASLLAVGGVGAVEDATMYSMISQLALSLRVVLLMLGRHPVIADALPMRHWVSRMIRAFLTFFGNCLTTYAATHIDNTTPGLSPLSHMIEMVNLPRMHLTYSIVVVVVCIL